MESRGTVRYVPARRLGGGQGQACSPGVTYGARLPHHFDHPYRWEITGTTEGESPLPEHMPLCRAGLSTAERQYRIDTKSCLYCGTLGHFVSSCPLKKPGSPVGASILVGHMENVPASPAHTPFTPFCCAETSPNLSGFSLTLETTKAFWMLPWSTGTVMG